MTVFWCLIFGLICISYVNAKQKGVPWFSMGQSVQRQTAQSPRSLRTKSIKPKSPHLVSNPKTQQVLRQTPIPSKLNKVEIVAFHRLNELTHNKELTQRLINNVQARNLHRNRLWCIEKAIYDIERDRMAR